jgi:hypothetical protein
MAGRLKEDHSPGWPEKKSETLYLKITRAEKGWKYGSSGRVLIG